MAKVSTCLLVTTTNLLVANATFFNVGTLTVLDFMTIPLVAVLKDFSIFGTARATNNLRKLVRCRPARTVDLTTTLAVYMNSFVDTNALAPSFTQFSGAGHSTMMSAIVTFFVKGSVVFLFNTVNTVTAKRSSVSRIVFVRGLVFPTVLILNLGV